MTLLQTLNRRPIRVISDKKDSNKTRMFVDVCGRCCVLEEFPLYGGGSAYCIDEIKRAGDAFFPGNRQV